MSLRDKRWAFFFLLYLKLEKEGSSFPFESEFVVEYYYYCTHAHKMACLLLDFSKSLI